MAGQLTALVIGDDGFRAAMQERGLARLGIMPACAADFEEAEDVFFIHRDDVHVVLLQSPGDAPDEAERIKHGLALTAPATVPLIAVGEGDTAAAIRAGAFHHLPPECESDLLQAAISAAVQVCLRLRQLDSELRARSVAVGLLTSGTFRFRTPDEANALAIALSSAGPNPQRLALGLLELMLNAIEHGNLGIGAELKSQLRAENRFAEEVDARLARPENRRKWATLHVMHDEVDLTFTIADTGEGFDWRNHETGATSGAPILHGRGILLARVFGFDRIQYEGNGNRVVAVAERAGNPVRR